MFKKLSETEINVTIGKIKERYKSLMVEFNKPKTIITSFEDRYINALKNKMDISVFLLAEIQAVDELYKKELEKKAMEQKEKEKKKNEHASNKDFADKVMEENRKKILIYEVIKIHNDADEELERLIGAVRELINDYWPGINFIFKNDIRTSAKTTTSEYFHKLLTLFDYRGDVPIAEAYVTSLSKIPRDFKRIESNHHYLLKESAFLLNEILENLTFIINNNNIPQPDEKLKVTITGSESWYKKHFQGLSNKESFLKVYNYLKDIIINFRIKDIKKSANY